MVLYSNSCDNHDVRGIRDRDRFHDGVRGIFDRDFNLRCDEVRGIFDHDFNHRCDEVRGIFDRDCFHDVRGIRDKRRHCR